MLAHTIRFLGWTQFVLSCIGTGYIWTQLVPRYNEYYGGRIRDGVNGEWIIAGIACLFWGLVIALALHGLSRLLDQTALPESDTKWSLGGDDALPAFSIRKEE